MNAIVAAARSLADRAVEAARTLTRNGEAIGHAAEQREHREIDFAMTAVHGWIDDHRLAARARDVAPPQIAVQTRWRLDGTEHVRTREQRIELAIETEPRARA